MHAWTSLLLLSLALLVRKGRAATLTVHGIGPSDATLTADPAYSNAISYSQEGVKIGSGTEGGETTYRQEIHLTEALQPNGTFVLLSATETLMATLVQSSGGFWYSQDITLTSGPQTTADANYQSCSLQEDGQYVCVQNFPFAGTGTTTYTNTVAATAVFTNVGTPAAGQGGSEQEGGHANHENAATRTTSAMVWRLLVVVGTMAIGAGVVL